MEPATLAGRKAGRNPWVGFPGILLPKLFWPTVRKNCFSDQEIFSKFEGGGQEFVKVLRSLD